jgi:hypothetical protein
MVDCAKCRKEIATGQEVVKKGFLGKKSYHMECAPTKPENGRPISLACPEHGEEARHRTRI